jgi:hypothetical protein
MQNIFGARKPELLRALVDICFSPDPSKHSCQLIDQAIRKDSLTSEQYRLLPLMFGKPALSQFDQSSVTKIQSAYKHTFYRNHVLLNKAHLLRAALMQWGFEEPLFLKGVPSCLRSSSGVGSRPMADVDLLVKDLHMHPNRVLDFFQANQLKPLGSTVRSITVQSKDGFQFDLHWYLSDWALSSSVVNCLFEHSENISVRHFTLRTPCIEHNLLHTMGHGLYDEALRLDARWTVDALILLTSGQNFCADKLVEIVNLMDGRNQIGAGLRDLSTQTPEHIAFDRKLLCDVSNRIKPATGAVRLLFDREPVMARRGLFGVSRRDRMKYYFATVVYAPLVLWRVNGMSLGVSFGLVYGFPPTGFWGGLEKLIEKIRKKYHKFFNT